MRKKTFIFFLAICLGLGLEFLSVNAMAQSSVHYLKDQEITKDRLIEILSGHTTEPADKPITTRGIRPTREKEDNAVAPVTSGPKGAVASPQTLAAQCGASQRRTRGIQAVPVSDAAAMGVQFAFNSANLSPQAEKTLNVLADALNSNQLKSSSFEIEGHTDSIGSERYNQQLSDARAKSVVVYLVRRYGVEAARLTPIGCGQQYPIESNGTESGRQMNRRVQIQSLSK